MRPLALIMILATAGCAALNGQDARRTDAEARTDDARCTSATVSFPSDAYLACRLKLAQQRADKQRHEVALGTQRSPYESLDAPVEPEGLRRVIDPERFHCRARGEGEARVVLCEEK